MDTYIVAPVGEVSHYITITEVGFKNGLAVRWTRDGNTWKPAIKHLEELEKSDERYVPVQLEEIDPKALMAITGIRV